MKLNDLDCKRAAPNEKQYKLADGHGLYLLVRTNGSKLWQWKYKFDGKEKVMSFGPYPFITLSKVRQLHQVEKAKLLGGVDPMAQRKQEKEADENTFRRVAETWRNHWAPGKTAKHDVDVWRRLEVDIFPKIGHVPVKELTAAHVRDCVKAIEARGAGDIAKRQLQKCNQIMRYAVAHDLAERNPVADVKPGDILRARKKRNYSRVEAEDLPQLLHDIDNYVGSSHTRLAIQLMALTFVRTGELIAAKWQEFSDTEWRIPAERMKMKTPHIVPLSKQAKAVLEQLRAMSYGREYVFPNDLDRPTHMSNNTILYALYRMGYRGRMTGHGFRGVASTILHEQGYQHEHIELQLAHQERDETSAAYNHALYLPQRAVMMQDWGDYLDAMRKRASKVINTAA